MASSPAARVCHGAPSNTIRSRVLVQVACRARPCMRFGAEAFANRHRIGQHGCPVASPSALSQAASSPIAPCR
jgi:hypothetical protein